MSRVLLVLGLVGVVSAVSAGDLARYARFAKIHGGAAPYEVAVDGPLAGGLTITGEKILLENGAFTATVQKISHAAFTMANVSAQGRMPLDDAFFADPITAAVNNFLNGSKMGIGSFKNAPVANPPADSLDLEIKDIQIEHAAKALKGSMKVMVLKPEFAGHSSYDKASKKLTIAVDAVTMGGINVPLDLAFYVMGQVVHYPFVTLARPNVILDLGPFLPNVGGAPRVP